MPAFRVAPGPVRASFVAASLLVLSGLSAAATAPAAGPENKVENSNLDAPLFYQLLLGEIELRDGQSGTAYQLMLDAAKRSKDEELFKRATEIALQARAGEQALAAAVLWRQTLPDSQDAMRYQIQLLIALNRLPEVEEPLVSLLRRAPRPALPGMLEAVPRFLARAPDRNATAVLAERALQPFVDERDTRASALVAVGRAWLLADDRVKALAALQRASETDPSLESAALLALDMLPGTPEAEVVVTRQLAAKPSSPTVRLLYVRLLATSQRLAEATTQVQVLTQSEPNLAPPWLTLGALELEMRRPKEASAALQNYVRLVEGGAPVNFAGAAAPAPVAGDSGDDDDDTPPNTTSALTQAFLLLAQAAELDQDFAGAEKWLARIDSPQRALEVQARRASLLARQGKMAQARELIRRVPEQSPGDARAKLLAESELLRDRKMFGEAEQVLAKANKTFPDDTDLLYEQAMIEEKLDRVDVMEKLLRRVIELKADHQQAYNALGYTFAERKIRLPEARALIQKALDLSPGEPSITDSMGWVEYRLGNRDEAIRLLRGAYQARPDPEIGAHLGEVLWSAGQSEEAKRVFREARSRDAQNDVLRETLARLRVDL